VVRREVNVMAVEEITIASELMVNVEDGVNARGIPVIRARRYDGVKPAANAADLMAVGQALGSLQDLPLAGIQRRDLIDLEESV
jgi:hypothetical protein